MNSRISLATAFGDAQREDEVIAALDLVVSEEFQLVSRACTFDGTQQLNLEERINSGRLLLIHDGGPEASQVIQHFGHRPSFISFEVKPDRLIEGPALRSDVLAATRRSEEETIARTPIRRLENLIAVTGTSGAPGVTSIVINLGYEMSRSTRTLLVDQNQIRRDIAFLFGAKLPIRETNEIIQVEERLAIASAIPSDLESIRERTVLVDCGFAPDMKRASSDRRAVQRTWFDLIEMSSMIIFVVQPEETQLHETERFLSGLTQFAPDHHVLIIINKVGDGPRARGIRKKLQIRLATYPQATLLPPIPLENDLFERAKSELQPAISLAPKRRLRRSIQGIVEVISLSADSQLHRGPQFN